MSDYFDDALILQFVHFLESGDGRLSDSFDHWLMDNYPHIRVMEIGDTPVSYWFSQSRINPYPQEDVTELFEDLLTLNVNMHRAWLITVDSSKLFGPGRRQQNVTSQV